jgi:hypothetical protein
MGAKGEAFAKQFEAKVEEATALLEKLSETDWKKTTAAEKWTVAVTAHHIASSYESATHIIKTIAAGQALQEACFTSSEVFGFQSVLGTRRLTPALRLTGRY